MIGALPFTAAAAEFSPRPSEASGQAEPVFDLAAAEHRTEPRTWTANQEPAEAPVPGQRMLPVWPSE